MDLCVWHWKAWGQPCGTGMLWLLSWQFHTVGVGCSIRQRLSALKPPRISESLDTTTVKITLTTRNLPISSRAEDHHAIFPDSESRDIDRHVQLQKALNFHVVNSEICRQLLLIQSNHTFGLLLLRSVDKDTRTSSLAPWGSSKSSVSAKTWTRDQSRLSLSIDNLTSAQAPLKENLSISSLTNTTADPRHGKSKHIRNPHALQITVAARSCCQPKDLLSHHKRCSKHLGRESNTEMTYVSRVFACRKSSAPRPSCPRQIKFQLNLTDIGSLPAEGTSDDFMTVC